MTPEEILRKRREQGHGGGAPGSPSGGTTTTTVNNPISGMVRSSSASLARLHAAARLGGVSSRDAVGAPRYTSGPFLARLVLTVAALSLR